MVILVLVDVDGGEDGVVQLPRDLLRQCFKKIHPKVRNHGEGSYSGLLLVESGYQRFHI